MQLFGIPLKLEVSIKGCRVVDPFVPLTIAGFFSEEIWLGVTGHCRCRAFLDCLMEEAYGGGSDVIISCESGRRP